MQSELLKTHPWLNVNGMGDAQAFRLPQERLAHVTAPDDDQPCTGVLF